jgi:3-oxoacyl-[acyl-carrier-protein] synthase III
MRRNQVAVVGAAETTELGVIPNVSQIQLHADAALNAIADAGLKLSDIDGFATAVETPQQIAHYLGITPARSCCMSAMPRPRSRPGCARPC